MFKKKLVQGVHNLRSKIVHASGTTCLKSFEPIRTREQLEIRNKTVSDMGTSRFYGDSQENARENPKGNMETLDFPRIFKEIRAKNFGKMFPRPRATF